MAIDWQLCIEENVHIPIPKISLFDNQGNPYKVVKFAPWYVEEDATINNSNVVDDSSAVDFIVTELHSSGDAEMQVNAGASIVESSNDSECCKESKGEEKELLDDTQDSGIAFAIECFRETEVEELIACDEDAGIEETQTNDTGYSS